MAMKLYGLLSDKWMCSLCSIEFILYPGIVRQESTTMGYCTRKMNSLMNMRPPMSSRKEEILLRVPGASVHLMGDTEVVGLAQGDFTIIRITEGDVLLATKAKVGLELQWPLTKDEPVVKLDKLHYLFTLPDKEGGFLNYGVSFTRPDAELAHVDEYLKESVCFSSYDDHQGSRKTAPSYELYWKDYAPRIDDYNGVLAKAIAEGTGEIVKGIFKCSNAYSSLVHKGADLIHTDAAKNTTNTPKEKYRTDQTKLRTNTKPGEINQTMRRVRKISETTEKMSRGLLEGVLTVSGAMAVPLIQSKAGQAFFGMVPGEVMLASFDGINKVMDAVEVAQRKALAATSTAVTGEVTKRFGESAGEMTEDVFATAGHVVGTGWNLLKIRKAVKPSSLPSTMLKNAAKRN